MNYGIEKHMHFRHIFHNNVRDKLNFGFVIFKTQNILHDRLTEDLLYNIRYVKCVTIQ